LNVWVDECHMEISEALRLIDTSANL